MKQFLHLSLATPTRQMIDIDNVEIVNAPGELGDVGILPNHAPFLTKLRDGILNYRIDNQRKYIGVSNAFMDVCDNTVTIITDVAILPEEADKLHAEEIRRQAKEQLEKKLEGTDFRKVEAELRKALLELKLVEHAKMNKIT